MLAFSSTVSLGLRQRCEAFHAARSIAAVADSPECNHQLRHLPTRRVFAQSTVGRVPSVLLLDMYGSRKTGPHAQMPEVPHANDGLCWIGGHSQLEFGDSQESDFLGGSSLLASAISEYVIFVRIREVETVALRNLQEMVTQRSRWLSLSDPFDLELTVSAWRFHLNLVEQQARQVTARVDPSIMLGEARKNLQGLSEKHSISDVDRACKRLGAWTRLMMSLIPYKDAVCKDLVMSPVDPSTSKRRWESHLFELRQCVDLLKNELPGTCGEFIDMCPDSPAEIWKDDFRGGASSAGIICSLRAGGADEDTGRQQLAFTHEQWYCLSAKRRTALVRQEARQEAKDSDDYLCFLRMWHKSFSLYCGPSYSENATAKIRLPCFSPANEQLPELPDHGDDLVLQCRLPNVQCELLVRRYGHSRDARITFTEATHSYHVDGCRMPISVTGLVHRFAQDFDADNAISKMMASSRWLRPEYARKVAEDGLLHPLSPEEIKQLWRRNAREAATRGHLDAPSD